MQKIKNPEVESIVNSIYWKDFVKLPEDLAMEIIYLFFDEVNKNIIHEGIEYRLIVGEKGVFIYAKDSQEFLRKFCNFMLFHFSGIFISDTDINKLWIKKSE